MAHAKNSSQIMLHDVLHDLIVQRPFSNLPFDQQLMGFAKVLADNVGASTVVIRVLNPNLRQLDVSAAVVADDHPGPEPQALALDNDQVILRHLDDHKIIALPDLDDVPPPFHVLGRTLKSTGATSALFCPLFDNDEVLGALTLTSPSPPQGWTPQEQRFTEAVAGLISMAMAQADSPRPSTSAVGYKGRLELFAKMANDRLWETDDALKLTSVISGRTASTADGSELIGFKPWEVPTRAPRSGDWGPIRRLMENHEVIKDLIIVDTNPDGSKSYREGNADPQFDQNGAFTGYIGVTRDVTERLQYEAELQVTNQRYRNASQLACLGHWVWDRDADRCSFCSPEMAAIFGVSPEDYVARTCSFEQDQKWYHPEDRERYVQTLDHACQTGSGWTLSVRIVRDDGTVRHLKQWAEPGFDETGRVNSTLGVLLDVTDHIEMEEKLRDSQAKLANLVDNLPGAVFRVRIDHDWSAVYRSKGYYRHFVDASRQMSDWEEFGKGSLFTVDDADAARIRQSIQDAVAENKPYELEYGITTQDGRHTWVWERGRPVKTANGEIQIEGIMLDATDKRRTQKALIKSQRGEAIGQLTGGVAHDFNNLLAVVLGNIELVKDEIDDPALIKMLDASINAATRGADLTGNMLAFARQAKLEPSDLNLNEVIQKAQSWIVRTLPSNIEVNTHLTDHIWTIRSDPSSTESAVLNLVINARDAMPEGGQLTIETANLVIDAETIQSQFEDIEPGEYVMMAVSDTGHGIPKDKLKQVFEPFYTTKAPNKGTGMGLSMVQGFIRQSGGTVRVYSEENVGTTFKLFFNAMARPVNHDPAPLPAAPVPDQHTGRILVAEDESGVLAILVAVLRKAGYDVVATPSGDAALEVFQADQNFDLLITDVVMPGRLLGPGLVREVRAIQPDLPAIFLTGYAAEATVHGNGLRPEDTRLMKPIRRQELLSNIKTVLEQRSGHKASQ
ncbi:MAG: PAS domain-containing protein [Pelagimonas sp.]|uniref:PAS domain-containing protein n=1 Tax=Pelagimonas sp. TaxID=2073170 RepID=UPI003D6A3402